MSGQLNAGVGAVVRSPSGDAALAPSPPSSPLSPQRYRALRARYNALLVTLYERTSLTRREIAALAGRTDRAVTMQVRALGCRPRNAKACRPGTNVGVRRRGRRLPPLSVAATRRAAEAFAEVARELAASAEARLAFEFERATERAQRRVERTRLRMLADTARSVRHLAATMETTSAMRRAHAAGEKRLLARDSSRASRPRSRPDFSLAQERTQREQTAAMYEAHEAVRRAKAAAAAAAPARQADADQRINEIAERTDAGARQGPRIRRL
jgi:hypothetical protein